MFLRSNFVVGFTLLIILADVFAVQDENGGNIQPISNAELKDYLIRNGYLTSTPSEDRRDGEQDLTQAIIDLQTYLALEPTGQVDALLISAISGPRCGMADLNSSDYRAADVKYNTNSLTYWIGNFPSSIDQDDVRMTIRDAFKVWTDVTPLTLTEVYNDQQADIKIQFGRREHGDGAPFDGRGGILAHAYLPLVGDAHFDADESWTIGTFAGTNLFQVATHEFGHSLGLYHSDDITALMYPYYRGYQTNFRLSEDDIEGIRSLYGSDGPDGTPDDGNDIESTTPSGPVLPSSPPPGACLRNGTFDAVVNTNDGHTYGFIGSYVWRLDVYPRTFSTISDTWPGLQNYIQAAVKQGDTTYILKGCYVTLFENRVFKTQLRIRDQWPGLPCNVDAGYTSPTDGFTYFFKGVFVYRFRGNALTSRRRIWTMNFGGLPWPYHNFRVTAINPNVNDEGALVNVYVFSGNIYYLFDDEQKAFLFPSHYPRHVNRYILSDCPRS